MFRFQIPTRAPPIPDIFVEIDQAKMSGGAVGRFWNWGAQNYTLGRKGAICWERHCHLPEYRSDYRVKMGFSPTRYLGDLVVSYQRHQHGTRGPSGRFDVHP